VSTATDAPPAGCVLIRLDGAMQAWGTHSRFEQRDTGEHPTASGVIGLIACALGRDEDEPLGELGELEVAVRIDDEGRVMRDFQTIGVDGWVSAAGKVTCGEPKLSKRFFLADAVFTVAVGHPDGDLLERIAAALIRPVWPVYLGRRAFPPSAPLLIGTSLAAPTQALLTLPYQGHRHTPPAALALIATSSDGTGRTVQDVPLDFGERTYGLRTISSRDVPSVPRETPRPAPVVDLEPDDADTPNPYGI